MDFSSITCPIRSFQTIIHSAASLTDSFSKEDLFLALKSSITLTEKIVEVMQSQNRSEFDSLVSRSITNNTNNNNNSFLTFHNYNSDQVNVNACSNQINNQESSIFSNNLSFSNVETVASSGIISSSSDTIAAINGFIKNGFISNNESSPFCSQVNSNTERLINSQMKLPSTQNLQSSSSFPMKPTCLSSSQSSFSSNENNNDNVNNNKETKLSKKDLNSKCLTYKRFSSKDLNQLLESCEIMESSSLSPSNNTKNYRCKFCGKTYKIKSSIRYHIRIIHLKLHLKTAEMHCKFCGKVFTCSTAANKHQMRCIKSATNHSIMI